MTHKTQTRMSKPSSEEFRFEGLFPKPIVAKFNSELRTSDGGAPLLAALDRRIGMSEMLCGSLRDVRDQSRVQHSLLELFRQRVFSIALGYPDGNDSARIGHDPAMKMICGRAPLDPSSLASQPTLSRFERGPKGREVIGVGRKLEAIVIDRIKKRHARPKLITIDLDPSVDPTHGQQPFSFFHGHYDTWCYLPMFGFLSIDDDPEQYLFYARLRPGLSKEVRGTIPLLRRTVKRLRRAHKKVRIRVRLDAGFACPQLFAALEELKVEYLVAMPENSVLTEKALAYMNAARSLTASFEETTTLFGECRYKTRSWDEEKRVIFKAEVVHAADKSPKNNARFVVTNVRHEPERAWEIYCQRGDSENRIKELKRDLEIDRTSCSSFIANQVRVLLTATAFVLFQELRASQRGTSLARCMVATLRLRLLKIGATIKESSRRIVVSMPSSHPWKDLWRQAAERVAVLV
jgi:hypothetical protein